MYSLIISSNPVPSHRFPPPHVQRIHRLTHSTTQTHANFSSHSLHEPDALIQHNHVHDHSHFADLITPAYACSLPPLTQIFTCSPQSLILITWEMLDSLGANAPLPPSPRDVPNYDKTTPLIIIGIFWHIKISIQEGSKSIQKKFESIYRVKLVAKIEDFRHIILARVSDSIVFSLSHKCTPITLVHEKVTPHAPSNYFLDWIWNSKQLSSLLIWATNWTWRNPMVKRKYHHVEILKLTRLGSAHYQFSVFSFCEVCWADLEPKST